MEVQITLVSTPFRAILSEDGTLGQKVTQTSESSDARPVIGTRGTPRVDRCANEGCKEAAQAAETSES